MSNACTGKKCAITSSGPPVVEDGAVVGQKVAVDVPIARLGGALEDDAGVTGGSEIPEDIGGGTPVLLPRRMIHARQSSDMISNDG